MLQLRVGLKMRCIKTGAVYTVEQIIMCRGVRSLSNVLSGIFLYRSSKGKLYVRCLDDWVNEHDKFEEVQ